MSSANPTGRDGVAQPKVSIDSAADLSERERTELGELGAAVYPPQAGEDWWGAELEWAPAQWRVRVWAPDTVLACHAGLLVRSGVHDGREVAIAGIGGVQTHPRYRRRGYAREAMQAAEEYFRSRGDVDIGLLVCEPPLLPYYAKLGWREFTGQLLVTQFGDRVPFTHSPVMTLPILGEAPAGGVIDLGGPPW